MDEEKLNRLPADVKKEFVKLAEKLTEKKQDTQASTTRTDLAEWCNALLFQGHDSADACLEKCACVYVCV